MESKQVFIHQSYGLGDAAQIDWYEAYSGVGRRTAKDIYFVGEVSRLDKIGRAD
jgi:hypothetical protein